MIDFSIDPQYCRRPDGTLGKTRCWDSLIRLFNQYLGNNYLMEQAVADLLENHEYAAMNAAVTGTVPVNCAGGVLLTVLSQSERQAHTKVVGDDALRRYRDVGFVKALVVDSSYRRQGIGKALILDALRQFAGWGCEAVLTVAWLPADNRGSSLPLFENLDFRVLTIKKNYWRRSSMKENFQCPACGSPPCHCDAAFLLYTFNSFR